MFRMVVEMIEAVAQFRDMFVDYYDNYEVKEETLIEYFKRQEENN